MSVELIRVTYTAFSLSMSFENHAVSGNGVIGTGYHRNQDTSLYDLRKGDQEHGTCHYNETALDMELTGHSQVLPSQLSVANTELFQKNTLPELSPMSYSLTANYPFPSEDHGLYLNTLPASTLSLRQPTMFGLSLQNEESKSAQGSRLSIHGSRPSIHESRPSIPSSIHGSRPSIHGSRPSIHESRPSIYGSRGSSLGLPGSTRHMLGMSGDPLLLSGEKYDKEHNLEDGGDERDSLSLSNRVPSPISYVHVKSNSMEVPTRDTSPLPRPPYFASSHPLGHGKKDFASLTCIVNAEGLAPSPEPEVTGNRDKMTSPTHKSGRGKRDLTTLTSLPEAAVSRGDTRPPTIPEESPKQSPKVKGQAKDGSPSNKKGRSKTMSRLEKLTSLDYIRQSFRIKKKKVSFQNVKTPEATPIPPKKSAKKATPAPSSNGTVFTNTMAAEKLKESPQRLKDSPQRRISTASSDMFSPTEDSFLRQQQNYVPDHLLGMGPLAPGMYPAQLSQSGYYVPPGHQYGYPLSQQYYPQLSQGYNNPYTSSPYHQVPLNDFAHGGGAQRDVMATRYQEVVTPDYSDLTSPEHEHYRGKRGQSPESMGGDRQGSEYSYDLRPHSPGSYDRSESPQGYSKHRGQSPDKFVDSMEHYKPRAISPPEKQGGHSLGARPDYFGSPARHMDPFLVGSPQRYGVPGHMAAVPAYGAGRRGSMDQERGPRGGVRRDSIPESSAAPYFNSISVDEPYQHYSIRHHPHAHQTHNQQRRYSGYSESSVTSDPRFQDAPAPSKSKVSWSSEVKEYPANDTEINQ